MGITAYQVIQFILLLSVIALAYRTISIVMEARTSSKFVLKSVLQDDEYKAKSFQLPRDMSFLERITSYKKYIAHLENEIAEARLNTTANRFLAKRVTIAFLMLVLSLVLYKVSSLTLYLYLAVPLGVVAYIIPKRQLKKSKRFYEQQMKLELPEFLSSFAVLLQSYTPFEATKKSVEYAGPVLQPYVQRLVTQMELYPARPKPYNEFAESVGIREAKEFMVALQQIMNVDATLAEKIIKDQIKTMNELEEEAYNELIEERPDEVQKFITPLIFPLVAICFTFLFILIANAFSSIN